jgi:hypothetical protein
MGCCHSVEDINYEKQLERQRLLGTNYSKLMESALCNNIDISKDKHVYREAMDSKYEYTSVMINQYKCLKISLDNGCYEITMFWKMYKGRLLMLSVEYDGQYILDRDRLRSLVSQKITLDTLLDAYFEYVDGHVKSIRDIVKFKTGPQNQFS